jgi:hypothetical protein
MVEGATEIVHPPVGAVRDRIASVERQIDSNTYTAGPWHRIIRDARNLPIRERAPLRDDISRVSRKLHQRGGRTTMSVATGLAIEVVATVVGAVLLMINARNESNLIAIIAALLWMTTFQPLIKVGVGYLLGIGYEYMYLWGAEPRFKMRFGEYIAAARWKRVLLHLSGLIGSPLGLWLAIAFTNKSLWVAIDLSWILFWIIVAINIASFVLMMAGLRQLGPMKLADGSGGQAAIELREALEV